MFHALAQRARKWYGTVGRIKVATLDMAGRACHLSRGVYLTIQRCVTFNASGFVSQCQCGNPILAGRSVARMRSCIPTEFAVEIFTTVFFASTT